MTTPMSRRDLEFLLYEWLDVEALTSRERFSAHSRETFDAVLDLLSGRYPSDEFAELRPRVNWDRDAGVITGRRGAQRLAVRLGGAGAVGTALADAGATDDQGGPPIGTRALRLGGGDLGGFQLIHVAGAQTGDETVDGVGAHGHGRGLADDAGRGVLGGVDRFAGVLGGAVATLVASGEKGQRGDAGDGEIFHWNSLPMD